MSILSLANFHLTNKIGGKALLKMRRPHVLVRSFDSLGCVWGRSFDTT